jgi:biotin carboxyl carrier protein
VRYYVTLPGVDEVAIDVTERPGGAIEVRCNDQPMEVDEVDVAGAFNVRVGTRVFDLWLEHDGETLGFVTTMMRGRARVESTRSRIAASASRSGDRGGGMVVAPMPGRVVKIMAEVGQLVEAGVPLVVVEAMKMENELSIDRPGIVRTIRATPGENVEAGAVLVELGPLEAAPSPEGPTAGGTA